MGFKVAVVGVVGRTNAGKSTLVNALVGEKVSIVSPVEQTTRNTIRGIVADPRGQLVLLDTPGLHKAVGGLGRILNRMARRSAAGTDVTCVVFDASQEPQLEDVGWMQRVARERPEKVVFVLNKADCSPFYETMFRDSWKEAQQAGGQEGADPAQEEAPVSPTWVTCVATAPGGANAVMDALFGLAEEGEALFDEDIVTDYPRRLAIADVIREKYLARLHQEVPHELGVLVKEIREEGGRWRVDAEVLVNRPSQKPIVIGRGAETVKYVRTCAARELSRIFDVKVSLELWVRVEPNWMKNDRLLAEMGYLGGLV
ncbi:MAG: GTPase Era [Kiritimatiellae bacterium]|nr:GTPase Era [Kiritimatiellia bacterium]MBQ6327995.1 GTPase Era [Kiritimatiellia bacterium]